jgi:hypothetical protein
MPTMAMAKALSLLLISASYRTHGWNMRVMAPTVAMTHGTKYGGASIGERNLAPRRTFLAWTTSASVLLSRPYPSQADIIADERLLKVSAAELKGVVSGIKEFEQAVGSEGNDVKLPSQVPLRVFQKLESKAHDVTLRAASDDGSDDGFFPAEDFLAVATEYAEHAGAARDLFKLSKLGRVGENGSEEVAKGYAKRCADEAKAASALLDVLAMAVQ